MMRRRRFTLILIFLLSIPLFITLQFAYWPLVKEKSGIRYTVRPGMSLSLVADELAAKKILSYPRLFKAYARYRGKASALKAGEYLFPYGATSLRILRQITTGSGMVYHAFTIVPGWNFQDVRDAILSEPYFNHATEHLSS